MLILLIIIFILLLFIYHKCYQLLSSKKDSIEIKTPKSVDTITVKRNENPIKAPERFSIKTFFASSKAEKIIYEYLQTSLSDYYKVIPHVSLIDLFSYSKPDGEDDTYNIYKLLGYHVDFVIFDELYHPVMGIELNGGSHKTDPKIIWTDRRKKELFTYFHIPLISLDLSTSYKDNELAPLLRSQITESIRIIYCWRCHTPIAYPFAECPKCYKKVPVRALFET